MRVMWPVLIARQRCPFLHAHSWCDLCGCDIQARLGAQLEQERLDRERRETAAAAAVAAEVAAQHAVAERKRRQAELRRRKPREPRKEKTST